jgi:hypothetical protein
MKRTRVALGSAIIGVAALAAYLYFPEASVRRVESSVQSGDEPITKAGGSPVGIEAANIADPDNAEGPPGPVADHRGIEQLALAGSATAQRQLSEMYETCYSYSRDPQTHVATMRHVAEMNPGSELRIEALIRRTAAYCSAFDGGQPIPLEASSMWLQQAAENGDLVARARIAGRDMAGMKGEEFDGLLNEILMARDSDAMFEFSALIRNAPPVSSELPDGFVGGVLAEHAWAIASCRLGATACRAGSAYMDSICGGLGRCNYSSYEHFASQELFSAADRARLEAAIREILILFHRDRG